ncbi:MAG TPA: primosomal protein N' [candidate division Zixibacteria bacterium]|nr:primosomal protein N' [candidate division Zixibacteria bacterium]
MSNPSALAEVAVSGPMRRTFTYLRPEHLPDLQPGQRLVVPFGRSNKIGFYVGPGSKPEGVSLKEIHSVLDAETLFSQTLFDFCLWLSDYYFANPADTLTLALPPTMKGRRTLRYCWEKPPNWADQTRLGQVKAGRLLSSVRERELRRDRKLWQRLIEEKVITEVWPEVNDSGPNRLVGYRTGAADIWTRHFQTRRFQPELFEGIKSASDLSEQGWTNYQIREAAKTGALQPVFREARVSVQEFVPPRDDVISFRLNEEQQCATDQMIASLDAGFSVTLLHGITGSGKTLVYCHICRELLNRGKSALLMVPEIALSGQVLAFCRGFFGDQVTIIHSAMSDSERAESFRGIRTGRYRLVIGPRSALFAPLCDPGLIIVDEEHDSSYKQSDPAPRFHGRDAAVMRGKISNIPVLLGTASPSVETYYNVQRKRYRLLELKTRPVGARLPSVRVIDMRRDRLAGDLYAFSYGLKKAVQDRLDNNRQVILFLNRRGFSPQVKCAQCGHVPGCPNCRVNLTYHKAGARLTCHYCGYTESDYRVCSACGSSELLHLGAGTQKIEDIIPRLFENAVPIRLDSDSAGGRSRAFKILSDFGARKQNILLGTQMVTKGLDFPDVTLVGVLSADASLYLPDFRASEKTFDRLLQVAGRAGRTDQAGEVILQTFQPESPLIDDAARQDYHSFYEREIESREALNYPPFSHLVNFVFSSAREDLVIRASKSFRSSLDRIVEQCGISTQILGPAPCTFGYLRGRFRRHLFVKTGQIVKLIKALTAWERSQTRFNLPAAVRIGVDVDPEDML